MFTIKASIPYNLTESGQANPLRWTIVNVDGTTLTPLSAEMKCKDYFNDIVAAKRGIFFKQCGYDNSTFLQQEGCDILLTNLQCAISTFKSNLGKVDHSTHPIQVQTVSDTSVLIHISEYYFQNTYRISLITYLIRLSNNSRTKWVGITDLATCLSSNVATESSGLSSQGREFAKTNGWDVQYGDEQWWRNSNGYNSSKSNTVFGIGQMIHNCGVNAWSNSYPAVAV